MAIRPYAIELQPLSRELIHMDNEATGPSPSTAKPSLEDRLDSLFTLAERPEPSGAGRKRRRDQQQ